MGQRLPQVQNDKASSFLILCRYWETKQLPQFLLAAPALAIVLVHSWDFLSAHWSYAVRLGLVDNNLLGMPRRPCLAVRQYRVLPRESLVFVIHATALAIFALFFMHVQVGAPGRLILRL